MTIWTRFTAWLSGWPEPKAKKIREEDFLFVEEEKLQAEQEERIRAKNEPKGLIKKGLKKKSKGLNPKKKTFWNHENKN